MFLYHREGIGHRECHIRQPMDAVNFYFSSETVKRRCFQYSLFSLTNQVPQDEFLDNNSLS